MKELTSVGWRERNCKGVVEMENVDIEPSGRLRPDMYG